MLSSMQRRKCDEIYYRDGETKFQELDDAVEDGIGEICNMLAGVEESSEEHEFQLQPFGSDSGRCHAKRHHWGELAGQYEQCGRRGIPINYLIALGLRKQRPSAVALMAG